MAKKRMETWLALGVLGVGLFIAAILGLFGYMAMTTPLYSSAEDVPSVIRSTPSSKWAGAAEQARQIVRAGLKDQNLPGVSVAVGVGGEIVWAEGFGWADMERRMPVEPEMRFRIGTASKTLTAAAVGVLLEQGRLNVDDEIQQYVPELPKKQWPVTLRQVMAHTAGLGPDGEGRYGQRCERPVDGVKLAAQESLRFEPGTQYRYSILGGWLLVGAAIEAAADQPFSRFMRTQVLDPLGMNDTRIDSRTEHIPNRVTGYFPRFGADNRYGFQFAPDDDYSCHEGTIGFLSTPSDLVRFAIGMNSAMLLKPATVEMLQTSQRLPSGQETGYGLGWDLETVTLAGKQTRTIGYDGETGSGGITGSFLIFPDYAIVVAVTTNTSFADTPAIALKIAEAFAEQGKSPGR